ncbi:MAG: hypothetical protein A2942_04920 [Candidatus Lloydbacteria bacterium RIFCSPLOWO2_01_FULL_50_20]|uniref:Uncharacterized protein n=1 Tax=Candidatus Lloydbacteria bacterium RIFCSPLOWO2_01_FULL_50_20 TaxID=1798665 RepID=A0A1G2DFR4_9BACT|nr:MAG: hypothetical protein A3C13_02405 [Candidatus Lloydbacteria bacterium RIFCSPHIGHO2_02_FULL_50_11]OGZ11710.1 MAG: hypothetical protein A2942_04920 [Candidatus Lloydbacteria bacterium RIFCSPLOWO2_01_FULL_50_20]
MFARKLDEAQGALARIRRSRIVEHGRADVKYGNYSYASYRVEECRGAWKNAHATPLNQRELPFDRLVKQVSEYASLGLFFHPKRVEHFDRHILSMTWFLEFRGWSVERSDNLRVVLVQHNRKATFTSREGHGLMLAVAIYALFPRTV